MSNVCSHIARPLRIAALLLAACLAASTGAEDPPAAPDQGNTAPPAASVATPATIPSDLERLAEALPGEHRVLTGGGESFDVFVRSITGGPLKGALVLIPGDGGLPPTSEGLGALRDDLPGYGWTIWLISVPRPPRVQAITEPVPDGGKGAGDTTSDAATPPAADAPPAADKEAPPAKPEKPQEVDFPAPPTGPGLDAQIDARMKAWIETSQPRIAAAVAEAAKDGPVTVVAEGAAAALLTSFVANGAEGIASAILIDPVELQGADARWPEGLQIPVLEVLDAERRADSGNERRTRANAARLASYRQLTLPGGYQTEPGQPSVLARRVRGWLLTLPSTRAPDPGTRPESTKPSAAPSPEALGPNRS